MPLAEKTILLFIILALGGSIGGGGGYSAYVIKGVRDPDFEIPRWPYFVAFVFMGLVFGLSMLATGATLLDMPIERALGDAVTAGLSVTLTLAGIHIMAFNKTRTIAEDR